MPGEGIQVLHVALVAAVVLGAFSLLVMAQVLVIAQTSARRRRLHAAFDAHWRPVLAAASLGMGESRLPPPRRDREKRWLLHLWTHMQATLRGESHRRLNHLLCELQLDRYAAGLLGRHDVRAQLVALACFGHLADPGYWGIVQPMLRARSPIKAVAAAAALVAIDPPRAMREVLPAGISEAGWSRHQLAWLCKRAGTAAVTSPLLDLLQKPLAPAARKRLLSLLPFADPRAAAPWARRILDPGSRPAPAEDRVAALHVLQGLRDPADREPILAAIRDPDPDVRLAATIALGERASAADAPRFVPLLSDREWAVRQAAAQALAGMPGLDAATLDALAAGVEDRYGREALLTAMARRRG